MRRPDLEKATQIWTNLPLSGRLIQMFVAFSYHLNFITISMEKKWRSLTGKLFIELTQPWSELCRYCTATQLFWSNSRGKYKNICSFGIVFLLERFWLQHNLHFIAEEMGKGPHFLCWISGFSNLTHALPQAGKKIMLLQAEQMYKMTCISLRMAEVVSWS